MKTFSRVLFGFAAAFAVTSSAQAIPFTITNLSFGPGAGYGSTPLSNGSDDPDLLNATFLADAAPATFDLNAGAFKKFTFGTITLNEPCIDAHDTGKIYFCGVKGNETDKLDVTARFSFINPYSGISSVTATGVAIPGLVKDTSGNGADTLVADLTIDFSPLKVQFGDGGEFSIDLTDLVFVRNQSLITTATITLLSAPSVPAPAASVPEPASLGLLGLGLLGAGLVRRRKDA